MNLISHDTAYSLYLFSTFCDRVSLAWGILTPAERVAAEKYESRDWTLNHFLRVDDLVRRPSELGVRRRVVGDSLCWSFNLDTGAQGPEWRADGADVYSWSIRYSKLREWVEADDRLSTVDAFRAFIEVDEIHQLIISGYEPVIFAWETIQSPLLSFRLSEFAVPRPSDLNRHTGVRFPSVFPF